MKKKKKSCITIPSGSILSKSNHIKSTSQEDNVTLVLSCLKLKLMKPALAMCTHFAVIFLINKCKFADKKKSKTCLCPLPHPTKCEKPSSCRQIFVHPRATVTNWPRTCDYMARQLQRNLGTNSTAKIPSWATNTMCRNIISCPVLN